MQNMPTNRDAAFPRRQTDMSAHIRRTLWNGLALFSYSLCIVYKQTHLGDTEGFTFILLSHICPLYLAPSQQGN